MLCMYHERDITTILSGTPHAMDVPYMWGKPFLRHNPEVRNQSEIIDLFPYQEADDEYSYFMMKMWTDFAKYG